ncbi:MAG: SRPBCC domain-containing protein [Pirellulales bacterium]|nr:SRPBCC domain-containing protein [Pirellulales bacterium]
MKSDVKISENRLEITRVFDAPREQVFAAWKEAEQLQVWWGCDMTRKVESQIDFAPGGKFCHKMTIEGAGEMDYAGVFEEITEPEKIIYRADFGPIKAEITVEFHEEQGKTRLVLTQVGFPNSEMCEIVSGGFTAAFDKLERLLLQQAA